jgi:N4-gp56 family major capsid protein
MAAAAAANSGAATAAVTASNAYAKFLAMMEYFADNKVPLSRIIVFCSPAYYTFLKQDPTFLKASDLGQKMLINGQVGEVDGARLVRVPSAYLPANTAFIGCHPKATVMPVKLQEYKTHSNPPGINGWLVEGRVRYDAFVLKSKSKAVYTHKTA